MHPTPINVTVYPDEGEPYEAELMNHNHYIMEEIRAFINDLLVDKIENEINSPASARESVRVIEKLRESASLNGEIVKL